MKTLKILKCNPEGLNADCIIEVEIVEAAESSGEEVQLLRNVKVEEYFTHFLNEKSEKQTSHHIKMTISVLNGNFSSYNLSFLDFFRENFNSIIFYLCTYCEPKSIAFPVFDFRNFVSEIGLVSEFEDYLQFIVEKALQAFTWDSKHPIQFLFYTTDEKLNIQATQQLMKDYFLNWFLSEYESDVEKEEVKSEGKTKIDNLNELIQEAKTISLDEYIEKYSGKSFDSFINEYLNTTGIKSSKLYTMSQISKQDFSRIISKSSLSSKQEKKKYDAVALSIGMKMDIRRFQEALSSAGFALSNCRTKDLIIQYFVLNEIYDLQRINQELVSRNLAPLGNSIE